VSDNADCDSDTCARHRRPRQHQPERRLDVRAHGWLRPELRRQKRHQPRWPPSARAA